VSSDHRREKPPINGTSVSIVPDVTGRSAYRADVFVKGKIVEQRYFSNMGVAEKLQKSIINKNKTAYIK
jgi:hypothetical protein